ncbi:MAG: sodium/solute symporter [Candidatus Marinimicrobia bacterium]|jgi:SSS family solute:Na+ symporter|nr:sodium:proline symporter [Candidatus Neomarinimicrobiota bacterium]MDP6457290.1 sodium/solute symporter [Candidatus Neomarinimicrobiota bacterium]MDP6592704.1 sodium/solute symporter [Candidatus Neomarinimicrobiota bacterium]MDP6835766.1 sodium/solute symporter [Candidatus Neomarinimicrobiota bacterium]|tara:strand:+ start:1700 stop:3544 length:1845 start_codon:yes stop_codon:yes gene_type:complete
MSQTIVGTGLDQAVIIIYFVAVLLFGSYFGRYAKTTSDFFFGGRRYAWWLITISIVATGVGSHSFVKYSSKAFQYGFSSTMTYMNDWFFVPFFMFGWLPIIIYSRVRSIPEYFERRFNFTARFLATIMILLYMIGYIAIGFLTLATALYKIMGLPLMGTVIVIAVLTAVYMHFGGQTSVIFTDLLQGLILLFAGLFLFLLGIDYLGGFDIFWGALSSEQKLPLAPFNYPPDFNFVGIFWQDGIAGSIGFLFMNQGLIMRFMACKSVNEGRKAATMNILVVLPISAIVVSNAGWIGRAIVSVFPGQIDPNLNPNDVFVIVTNLVAKPGVFGFIIAALSAALMSTVDTLVNASANVFVNDLYRPFVKKEHSDKHFLEIARWTSVGVTALSVILVPVFNSFGTIYEAHGWFHSTFTPPLIVAVFLGIFWKRFTSAAVIATFTIGAGLMILGQVFPQLIAPFDHGIEMMPGRPYIYIGALYNIVVCAVVGVAVSLVTKPKNPEDIKGLSIFDVANAREYFKGSKPNDREGKKVLVQYRIVEDQEDVIRFSRNDLERMAADPGDLVYIMDKRKWMGGLKSIHSVYGTPHDEDGIVYVTEEQRKSGMFVEGRLLEAEKEM